VAGCFRFRWSVGGHRISPLASTYRRPPLPPLPITTALAPMKKTAVLFHCPVLENSGLHLPLASLFYHSKRPRGHEPLSQEQPGRNRGRLGSRRPRSRLPPSMESLPRALTTSVLTAAAELYTIGAGITAGAGTRLVLQLLLGGRFEPPPCGLPG